jgi:hypothetical protein
LEVFDERLVLAWLHSQLLVTEVSEGQAQRLINWVNLIEMAYTDWFRGGEYFHQENIRIDNFFESNLKFFVN